MIDKPIGLEQEDIDPQPQTERGNPTGFRDRISGARILEVAAKARNFVGDPIQLIGRLNPLDPQEAGILVTSVSRIASELVSVGRGNYFFEGEAKNPEAFIKAIPGIYTTFLDATKHDRRRIADIGSSKIASINEKVQQTVTTVADKVDANIALRQYTGERGAFVTPLFLTEALQSPQLFPPGDREAQFKKIELYARMAAELTLRGVRIKSLISIPQEYDQLSEQKRRDRSEEIQSQTKVPKWKGKAFTTALIEKMVAEGALSEDPLQIEKLPSTQDRVPSREQQIGDNNVLSRAEMEAMLAEPPNDPEGALAGIERSLFDLLQTYTMRQQRDNRLQTIIEGHHRPMSKTELENSLIRRHFSDIISLDGAFDTSGFYDQITESRADQDIRFWEEMRTVLKEIKTTDRTWYPNYNSHEVRTRPGDEALLQEAFKRYSQT